MSGINIFLLALSHGSVGLLMFHSRAKHFGQRRRIIFPKSFIT